MSGVGLLYEVWIRADGQALVCRAGPDGEAARAELGPRPRRAGGFFANSDLEVSAGFHRFMRWPPSSDGPPADATPFDAEARIRQRRAFAVALKNPNLADEPDLGANDRLMAWRSAVERYRDATTRATEVGSRMLALVEELAALPTAFAVFPSASLGRLCLSSHGGYPERFHDRMVVIQYRALGIYELVFHESSGGSPPEGEPCSQNLLNPTKADWTEIASWIAHERSTPPDFVTPSAITLGQASKGW